MEILLIIMLAPLAIMLGVGICRLLMEPAVWLVGIGLLALFTLVQLAHA
jgi:hypothetical protein